MKQTEYEQMYRVEEAHWWFISRRSLAAALLKKWKDGQEAGPVLDVGCGTGGNLEFLAGNSAGFGIDISPLALNLARRRRLPGLVQASALSLPFAGETFSLVTAFDVFYHRWIADDNQAIRECYRVLRPGGHLLLTDSALPGLWSPHDEVYYARQRYTLAEVKQKLVESGFHVCVCSYMRSLLLPLLAGSRLMMRWFPVNPSSELRLPPAWLNQALIGVHSLERLWLNRGGTLPIGSSLVCLVQKS